MMMLLARLRILASETAAPAAAAALHGVNRSIANHGSSLSDARYCNSFSPIP